MLPTHPAGTRLELPPSSELGEILMANNGRFQPGQSGNPATQFKPGNSHRWRSGQSGNPAGTSRTRRQFEERCKAALLGQTSAEEVANLFAEAVRKREPWAIPACLRRLAREAKQTNPEIRRNHIGMTVANHPVVAVPPVADGGGQSMAAARLATPAVEALTPAHVAERDASRQIQLKQRYEEFCLEKVKDHLRKLPKAVRSQRFDEMRSVIRRAAPQLRRNEVDEMAQQQLESKIRLALNLPNIEEFTAGMCDDRREHPGGSASVTRAVQADRGDSRLRS
jgi:hypothetical protein